MKKEKLVVTQKESKEEITVEVLAQSIKDISDGVKKLRSGRLNDKAIILLIQKSSGVGAGTVKRVIDGMQSLEKEFLK